MRWRWASVCHLLLLLLKIAVATEEDGLSDSEPPAAFTLPAVDNDSVAEEGAHNTSDPANEIGCEKPIDADFILDPFHNWIDGSPCSSNEECRALECCSMGKVEEAVMENRGLRDRIEGELKSVCRVKDAAIYVFFTLCILIILGFIVCCGCIICIRRSATLREEEFQLRDSKTNPRLPSMLPPAPE